MFNASIAVQRLKECIDALQALVIEAKINIKPDGISVLAVDPANVAAVSLELSSGAFESYKATEGDIGVDLRKLADIIDIAPKGGIIGLELDESGHQLIVKATGLTYTTSLLDPSSITKAPKIPRIWDNCTRYIKGASTELWDVG